MREIDYDKAYKIALLIHLYYTEFGKVVGGNLHVVLDDENTGDGYVEGCMADLEAAKDYLGIAIAKMLIECTEDERIESINRARQMDGNDNLIEV